MEITQIQEKLDKQKKYFQSGVTYPVKARKASLKKLYDGLIQYEGKLSEALQLDLGKSKQEGYMCEIGLVREEIRYMLKHIDALSKERRVRTPFAQTFSRSFVKPVPYGTVLIMSPWNYPVLLTLGPLVDALAAGNTAIVKPSAYAPATMDVLDQLLQETFAEEYVTLIKGGREENQALLECDFDYIFFTGSKNVGKQVMEKAAKHLIPLTLELGGKSPCIVDETADIKLAARRIIFGKFINCGQTCVAPDYVYCHASVKEHFVRELCRQLEQQYGENPLENRNYGKMINGKHFARVRGLIDEKKVVVGGKSNPETCQIQPTIMDGVSWEDAVMQEEIFGPVLPILTFTDLKEVAKKINAMDTPLALYLFSSKKENINFVKERIPYGGGCINDTLIHLATTEMGFGGVGESGMGSYHGKCGFETFSHKKSMVDKKTFLDLPMRYQPYTKFYEKLIRMFVH